LGAEFTYSYAYEKGSRVGRRETPAAPAAAA
jgi:hypothetical protein